MFGKDILNIILFSYFEVSTAKGTNDKDSFQKIILPGRETALTVVQSAGTRLGMTITLPSERRSRIIVRGTQSLRIRRVAGSGTVDPRIRRRLEVRA